ncbi:nitrate- and nitrite sensing domain-containing protein [Kitasatospora sp. NPDC052896]|uniref:sensor histidine kinase n=1 Tax=Kitasatospora sp. NPDC052896 TaxID=3364061 RepID=UPI0037C63D18
MRLRSSSIRAKIVALLLVPIVSLVALWAYATLVTTSGAWDQLGLAAAYRAFGPAVQQFTEDLQSERRAAALQLADPAGNGVLDGYRKAQADTDQDLQVLQSRLHGHDAAKLGRTQRTAMQTLLTREGQLGALRGQVGQAAITWEYALGQYTNLIQPLFDFRAVFLTGLTGQLPRQGTILIELARARDYLSQEDAAMEALQADGTPTQSDYQAVLDPMHDQQALYTVFGGELTGPDQAQYVKLQTGPDLTQLQLAEREFQAATDPADAAQIVGAPLWRETADYALNDLGALDSSQAEQFASQATSDASAQLWHAAIAGLAGLLAVVLSVLISFRVGRGLVRQLIGLRNAAHELAGTRLPAVMRRLRRGEPVDLAAEAPDLDFGPAEIGQVGRAFSAVQRAAIEAAVEQAELRRGVSAVFVNLARRSQVLLHRQLTLLDTMERRTEDPAELADLFRLDHLTTRMRRHAEGLIILSGGSPGRAWRRPVRMVDVVRAAIGEVEEYGRVVIRPFPGTGLLGSAVADVTHLIAELVENAAAFSPPHTEVAVQGEVVAHGFALAIDDRGLGLGEQALAEINERLAVEQEFDLADTDRLGLFVVSRLARRHGIRVSLRPSPYGGTTAVVLIPRELLAEVPAASAPAAPVAPVAGAVTGRPRELVAVAGGAEGAAPPRRPAGRSRGHQRAVTGPQPAGSEPGRGPGGLPRRRPAGGPVLVPAPGGTGRHRRPNEPDPSAQPDPSVQPDPVVQPDPAPGDEGSALPRRIRQASLAPQLKEAAARSGGPVPSEQPPRERSPEEARAAFASFQRGYRRGRAEPTAPVAPPAEPPAVSPPAVPVPAAAPGGRPALASAPVPPALPVTPRPAPPAPAEGRDR